MNKINFQDTKKKISERFLLFDNNLKKAEDKIMNKN